MISIASAIELVKFLFEFANGIKNVMELYEKITERFKHEK